VEIMQVSARIFLSHGKNDQLPCKEVNIDC